MNKAEKIFLYNLFVTAAALGLATYSAILATRRDFSPATYFMVIAVFLFSLREKQDRR